VSQLYKLTVKHRMPKCVADFGGRYNIVWSQIVVKIHCKQCTLTNIFLMREKTYIVKIILLLLLMDDDPDTAGDPTSPKIRNKENRIHVIQVS